MVIKPDTYISKLFGGKQKDSLTVPQKSKITDVQDSTCLVDFPRLESLYKEDNSQYRRSLIMVKVLTRSEELKNRYEKLGTKKEDAENLYNDIIIHLTGHRRNALLYYRKFFQKDADSSEPSEFVGRNNAQDILKDYFSIVRYFESVLQNLAKRFGFSGFMSSYGRYQKIKKTIWSEYDNEKLLDLPQIDWTTESGGTIGAGDIIEGTVLGTYGVIEGEENQENFTALARQLEAFLSSFEVNYNTSGLSKDELFAFLHLQLREKLPFGKNIEFQNTIPELNNNLAGVVNLSFNKTGILKQIMEFKGTDRWPLFSREIFYQCTNKDTLQDPLVLCEAVGYLEKLSKNRKDLTKAYDKIGKNKAHYHIYKHLAGKIQGDFSSIENVVQQLGEIIVFLSQYYEDIEKVVDWIGEENLIERIKGEDLTLIDLMTELNSFVSGYLPITFGKYSDTSSIPEEVQNALRGKKYICPMKYIIYITTPYEPTSSNEIRYSFGSVEKHENNPVQEEEGIFTIPKYEHTTNYPAIVYIGYDALDRKGNLIGEQVVVQYKGRDGTIFMLQNYEDVTTRNEIPEDKRGDGKLTLFDLGIVIKKEELWIDVEGLFQKINFYIRSTDSESIPIYNSTKKELVIKKPFGGMCDKVTLMVRNNTLVIRSEIKQRDTDELTKREVQRSVAEMLSQFRV